MGLLLLFRCRPSSGQANLELQPEELCADFATKSYPGSIMGYNSPGSSFSSWTFETCLDVWKRFASTIPNGYQQRSPLVDTWRETASELRRAGSPCLVATDGKSDGAGSTTIRHLSAWVFAREMGCDWVTPGWGKKNLDRGNGTTMYCHRAATAEEMDLSKPTAELQALRRCALVDWLSYFQFGVPSVRLPEGGNMKIIQVSKGTVRKMAPFKGPWSVRAAGFLKR